MTAISSNLDFLLDPASIAIVGASDNPDKIGGRPIFYMRRHGYQGKLYPVNPQRPQVQGEKTWPTVASLPEAPDLAIVAVPGMKAVEAVDDCAALGVKAAIVISAGFSEVGPEGRAVQDDMTRRARQAGLRIVGPNSQGLANFGTGAIASFSTMFLEIEPQDGPVAVISQSGGMSAMIYGVLRQRGIGVRHMHATGNEADVTVADLARAVLADPEVRIVLLYLESLQDTAALAEAAEMARQRGVPIIAVKAGRSEAGVRAAASHTGALANEDRAVQAFFEHHGILRARDPQELARYAELFIQDAHPSGSRVVIVSNSGASCVLASDAADVAGLQIASLADTSQHRLSTVLSTFATTNNPIDITAALLSNNRLFGEVLTAIEDDPAADMFVLDIPVAGRGYDVPSFAQDAASFARRSGKPVAVVAWQEPVAQAFRAKGVPVYADEQQAMSALAAMVEHSRYMHADSSEIKPDAAIDVTLPPGGSGTLSELDSLSLLSEHGISVIPQQLCKDVESALDAWRQYGVPVVLKACSAALPHKSEYGLVALGLNTEQAIHDAISSQKATLEKMSVQYDGWIVAPLRKGLQEMMAGMNFDPIFGPVVVFGAGGKYVEATPDVAVMLPPFSAGQVMDKLRQLRIWPLLQGVRGEPAADIQAYAELVAEFSRFALGSNGRLKSVDINPVMVGHRGEGAWAVDALIERI
ncbi:acetate--CoA ligase family protein [Pollutimonas harenae]|uniref:Acetate--CoA ligase family protein n=1 Tax=Pollutimonas harenae TaxID=657015 RepID=A0A853H394_9BURK|nr:acetate--CoA ligase family protein [Pollutimonas harenae]NYT86319.1 acetate--CoA ligase family protein [Pollutimonas harenae]TEA69923.1 CoA-binding protein [Pollutimonas harenae]